MIPVASEDIVIRKICGDGCKRRADLDGAASRAFSFIDQSSKPPRERVFFIPKPLAAGGGYTQAQLDEIERALACLGIDLLPLPNLH